MKLFRWKRFSSHTSDNDIIVLTCQKCGDVLTAQLLPCMASDNEIQKEMMLWANGEFWDSEFKLQKSDKQCDNCTM